MDHYHNRIRKALNMKIYTKTGDKGQTSLLGGTRVPKYHIRINAYGTIDELNSFLGLLRDSELNSERKKFLQEIQTRLFAIGSSLAAETDKARSIKPDITENDIQLLESAIDVMNDQLPQMRNFILPGGHTTVSYCHIARTVCRRAERLVIELNDTEEVEEMVIVYLNRLSDYLFTLARMLGSELNAEEIPWKPRS